MIAAVSARESIQQRLQNESPNKGLYDIFHYFYRLPLKLWGCAGKCLSLVIGEAFSS